MKKKNTRPRCLVHPKFRFKKKPDGSVVRTCTKCGLKITDLASGKFGVPVKPMKGRYKRKKDQDNDVQPTENL